MDPNKLKKNTLLDTSILKASCKTHFIEQKLKIKDWKMTYIYQNSLFKRKIQLFYRKVYKQLYKIMIILMIYEEYHNLIFNHTYEISLLCKLQLIFLDFCIL